MTKIKNLLLICITILTITTNINASNYSLEFDGTNDFISIPDGAGGDLDISGDLTIETWIYFDPTTSNTSQWVVGNVVTNLGVTSALAYAIRIEADDEIKFQVSNGSIGQTSPKYTMTSKKWYHIVGYFDSTNQKVGLYVDGNLIGVPVDTGFSSLKSNISSPVTIGNYSSDNSFSQYYKGKIDEVRIWSELRTATQIKENMYTELIGNETNLNAYYNFNETTGTSANDSTSNNNNGTLTNMAGTEWTEVQEYDSHHLMSFDGSTQFVDVGVKSDLQILDDLTLEGWLKYSSISGVQTIISNGTSSETEADNFPYYFAIQADGKLQVFWEHGVGTNTVLISDASIATITSANSWHHYSLVRDSNAKTVKFYIDGLQFGSEKSYSNNPTGGTTSSLTLAGEYSTSTINYFNGSMDEIRIWNNVRTQTEIQTNMNKELDGNETGLAAYYNFSSKDTQLIDTSYNGNVGTLINSPTWIDFGDKNLEITGIDDDVDLGDIHNDLTSLTFGFWLNSNQATDNLITKNQVYAIERNSGKIVAHFGDGTNWTAGITSTNVIPNNTWTYITITRNSSGTVKIYLNGVLDKTGTNSAHGTNTTHFEIGNYAGLSGGSDMKISEFSIFNRDLNATEISQLANEKKLRGNENGLVGYWPLDESIGSVANDKSSYNNNGTINGSAWVSSDLNITTIYTNENALIVADINSTPDYAWGVYSITGGADSAKFDINSSNGVLNFSSLTFATADSNYTVEITKASITKIYNIIVENASLNVAPTFTTSNPISTVENNSTVGTSIQASDTNISNSALDLSASTDYASISTIYTNSKSFTMEYWAAFTDLSAQQNLINFSETTNSGIQRFLPVKDSDNKIGFYINDGSTAVQTFSEYTVTNINEYHHYSYIYNGDNHTITLLVDGKSTNITNMSTPLFDLSNTTNNLLLGANDSTSALDSKIKFNDFRLWDEIRTQSQIINNMNYELNGNEINLIAYYRFDEISGTSISDSTSNGNNLTLINTTNTTSTHLSGTTPLSYNIQAGYDASSFDINSSTGVLNFNSNPNYEDNVSYELNVSVNDGILTTYKLYDINLSDVVEFDTFDSNASASYSSSENNSTVYTFTSDNSDVNYTITGGADAALFDINASTGELSFKATPNYEHPQDANTNNTYEVTVTVTDTSNNTTDTQTLTLNITNEVDEVLTMPLILMVRVIILI